VPFTQDASIVQSEVDRLCSVTHRDEASLDDLGDLETLVERIHTEAVLAPAAIRFMAIDSAWTRNS
jgi:hypothetical protein